MTRRLLAAALAAPFALSAAPAFAHLNPAEHGSMMAGIAHPLSGLDHILVMVAVGLWAAQAGGRAMLVVPAAFVTTMMLGFILAMSGVALPFVEPAILASVVALGLLVAMAVRLPAAAGAAVVGVFALFHGYAHGGELGSASPLSFGLGFALSTVLLHGAGLGLGMTIAGTRNGSALSRLVGLATAVTGAAMLIGA